MKEITLLSVDDVTITLYYVTNKCYMTRGEKKMRKINLYFFGEELVHWSDACWFYGVITVCSVVTGYVVFN